VSTAARWCAGEEAAAPVLLYARPPVDAAEERTIRKLAGARHAPGDWIRRAQMITGSWDGLGTTQIAERLGCHPQTVRERRHRFNAEGVDGLGDRPGPGRPRRLTEHDRGRIIALARSAPPGRLVQGDQGLPAPAQPEAPAHWTLDTLAAAAQAEASGWAAARSAASSSANRCAGDRPARGRPAPMRTSPQRAKVIACSTTPPPGMTVVWADELGPVIPRSFPPAPGWSADGHRVKAPLEDGRGPATTWGTARSAWLTGRR
jgi:transposase